jgi:ribosomal protein S18 acetylase RimI-like enzyme
VDFDVQHHTRTLALRSPGNFRVGPFVVRYDEGWSNPYGNYAIPDDGAEPTEQDVRALIEAFRDRDRKPRLEFQPSRMPKVEAVLLECGFEIEGRPPIMACPPENLTVPKPVPGLELSEPRTDEELFALASIQHYAFGEQGEPTTDSISGLRRTILNGGIAVLARLGGEPAGGGSCSSPVDGLTEIGGVAVDARLRRRGIGAAVSAHLTALAYQRGLQFVWLEPADETVERIYASIGYLRATEKLDISVPANA